ncbi:MAG: hypothetical protein HEP71_03175 [Roseivirga sp.]|nr:hypothetical protein [Roseivirga sp.]
MKRLLSAQGLSFLSILLVLNCVGKQAYGQNTKAWFKLGAHHYEVEVNQENGAYLISLTNQSQSPEIAKTQNTNYLNVVSFERIIYDLYKGIEADRLSKEVSEIAIPKDTSDDDVNAIRAAFLEIITSLYNTETKGQKIGEITLSSSVRVYDESESQTQSARGSRAAMRQRGSSKWKSGIENRKKRQVSKKIKRLTKKQILKGLNATETKTLANLELDLLALNPAPASLLQGQNTPRDSLIISGARVVFEDGSIKEVTVKCTDKDGNAAVYSNKFSIGASTRKSVQDFDKISLYQETSLGKRSDSKKIYLSDAVYYERIAGLRTNDYSPADVKIQLEPDKMQELFKAPSSQLFTLNVFSDLAGFDQNNPNGLVQLEFNKRINLWTRRTDAFFPKSMGIGVFTHMVPAFELTKIEENNRSIKLLPSEMANEQEHLSPLQLQRFSYAKLTNELNIFDFQGASMSIHFNVFGGLTVTHLQDTIGMGQDQQIFNENINSLILGGNIKAVFNPESKWAFELGSRWTYTDPLNSSFTFRSRENGELRGPNYLLNSWQFLLTLNTGATESTSQNKLFARFRFNHEWDYWNNNYSEFQIGYSIFLKSNQLKKK